MRHALAALISLIMFGSSAAMAADAWRGDLVFHAGQFDPFGDGDNNKSFTGGVEYRFPDQYHGLRPTIGVLGNTDKAVYGYAGINWDLPIRAIAPFIITPGVVAGGYSHGESKDLGYGLEFRSSLEVTYRMQDGQRIGAAISHLSNAGLGDRNPGTETIQAVYSMPF